MSQHRSIGKKIGTIARYLDMVLDSRIAHLGLGAATIPIITFLYENEGANQDALADALQFNKSSAARAVTRLEKDGFLTRTVDPANRRSNILCTTEKARSVKDEVYQILKGLTDDVFADFSDEDIDLYFNLTTIISTRVVQMQQEIK
ncbi:MarR family winged helix-turn-helix transcriptional regulator [Maridesulfovibrio sp. FT414]|uniref:MarR family winged helix-turn-helix transcriptional regulator n=1 Tax=Maridesulfovibrio sp. FT414 TaxID=2979469 RepID=UPI003D808248